MTPPTAGTVVAAQSKESISQSAYGFEAAIWRSQYLPSCTDPLRACKRTCLDAFYNGGGSLRVHFGGTEQHCKAEEGQRASGDCNGARCYPPVHQASMLPRDRPVETQLQKGECVVCVCVTSVDLVCPFVRE